VIRAILYLVIEGGISTTTVGGYIDATVRILASDGPNLNERGVRLVEAAKDHKILEQQFRSRWQGGLFRAEGSS
jgi:hypothetical protein